MTQTLLIGSRGSQLALWQARHVQQRLAALGVSTSIEIIRTTGDKITDVPLAKVGSKGLFTKEIEAALLDGRIDLAVHSLKDLPTDLPAGLTIAAIPERELAYDALIGSTLAALPAGAVVGTSSLRRAAQLRRLRPDLVIESVRGNLDTRLRKLEEGRYQAILLAAAGLRRLGWADRIAELLPPDVMCPAVGQGALAIETREAGAALEACRALDHAPTRAAVEAERAVLASLGGGCQVPIGASATIEDEMLTVHAMVAAPDGSTLLSGTLSGPAAEARLLGAALASRLLDQGARVILEQVYGEAPPLRGRRVVVTRASDQAGTFADALRRLGAEVVELPVIELSPAPFEPPDVASYQWVLFTSANAVRFFLDVVSLPASVAVASIGPATAAALRERGIEPARTARVSTGEGLAALFAGGALEGVRFLLPRAAVARDVVPEELRRRGAVVDVVTVYENSAPAGLEGAARALFTAGQRPDWVTFLSSSAVKNLLEAVGPTALEGVKIASIGPLTSRTVRQHGLAVTVEPGEASAEALAGAIAGFEAA
jgi:hydroxymethylbilane synthase